MSLQKIILPRTNELMNKDARFEIFTAV